MSSREVSRSTIISTSSRHPHGCIPVMLLVASIAMGVLSGDTANAAAEPGRPAAGSLTQAAPSRTIWDGVYSAAQAARGHDDFAAHCSACHGANLSGGTARTLTGDTFMRDWVSEPIESLFTRIKTKMPRGAPGSLSDDIYMEIVAYILEGNRYPAGATDLNADTLRAVRIDGKDGSIPNFSMVRVVGCLAQGPNNAWLVRNATDPVRTKDPHPSQGAERDEAVRRSLGGAAFRLLYMSTDPDPYKGHRVEVAGLLIRVPNDDRINVMELETLAPACQP